MKNIINRQVLKNSFLTLCCFSVFFLTISPGVISSEVEKKSRPDFLIGVGTHPLSYKQTPEEFIELLKKYNVKSIRFDYPWSMVEKQIGIYHSASDKLDKIIKLASENGIKTLIILDYGNKIYNIKKPISNDDISHFLKYVTWTVNNFKDANPIYEVWNEWSLVKPLNVSESSESAQQYFNLVKAVSLEIRKDSSNSILLAGSLSPGSSPNQIKWASTLMKLGIMDYVDGISIHPYNYWQRPIDTPQKSMEKINKIIQLLEGVAKKNINIYITEYGIPDGKNASLTQKDIYKYAAGYYSEAKKNSHIKGLWWYDFINDGNDLNNAEYNFGILNNDLSEKPISLLFRNDFN
ncbi:hypothetical protein [Klebsiella pneumoniae]|uniref:hypothetical protein n=1 Tax=Klebsiella pneumoniae TaxID=573 RepID=UPI0028B72781|nr:hypothetical protein [Klebsiella pneumoniae]